MKFSAQKKLIALLLVLVMAFSLAPAAYAEDGGSGDEMCNVTLDSSGLMNATATLKSGDNMLIPTTDGAASCTVASGTTLTLTIAPNEGYEFTESSTPAVKTIGSGTDAQETPLSPTAGVYSIKVEEAITVIVSGEATKIVTETEAMKNVGGLFENILTKYFSGRSDENTVENIISAMNSDTLSACRADLDAAMAAYEALGEEDSKAFEKANAALLALIGEIDKAAVLANNNDVAWIGNIGYTTLADAIDEAVDGATITLGEGSFSAYGGEFVQKVTKSLNFVGQGADKTNWYIGASVPADTTSAINYQPDYSFDNRSRTNPNQTVTFKNMTMISVYGGNDTHKENGVDAEAGFVGIDNLVFKNCTINGTMQYNGWKTTTFNNVTFNCRGGQWDYSIETKTGNEYTFNCCTFNTPNGKVINAYEYSKTKKTITINYKHCTVNSEAANKSVLNIKDGPNNPTNYIINISGVNLITGLEPNNVTCSRLFQVETTYPASDTYSTVKIDSTEVWNQNGMVSHSIDTANDKYTDGYEEDNFNYTYGNWEKQENGSSSRTVTKVCNYCGYTENTTQTINPDIDPGGPGSWDVSKSKTVTNLDSNFESTVTLGLPSATYKGNLDVAFVLDGSTSADQSGLAAAAAKLLDELAKMENLNVKAGLTVFGGSKPTLINTGLLDISDAANLSSLKAEMTNSAYDKMDGRSGSNLQAGVEAACEWLNADTDVTNEDKYMIILSDGAARMWYANGAAMSQTYESNGSVLWNSNCDWVDYRYRGKNVSDTPTFDSVWNAGHTNGNIGAYGMTKNQSEAAKVGDKGVASYDTVMNGVYYTTYEAATYYAAGSIVKASQESNVILVSYPYHDDTTFGQYIESFKAWLASNGYVTRYDSKSADAGEIFSKVKNQLIQVVDKGSTVTDVIGKTNDYNFDFVDNIDTLSLTVGGTALEKASVTSGLGANETSRYSFGNGLFVLHYYKNGTDGASDECFVWDINTAITKNDKVELKYKVKLTNPKTAAGTYGVYDADGSQNKTELYTNNSATLIPVDSNGNKGGEEVFPKPTVSYTVLPQTVSITVTKVWSDNNNAAKARPASVDVTLYKDGTAYKVLTLNAGGNWKGTFEDLPKFAEDGKTEIKYTVKESSVPNYTSAVTGDAANGFKITNTYSKPAETTVSFTVKKVWNDNNNAYGIRPASVTIVLYKDNQATDEKITLNAGNNWTHTWDNLESGYTYSAAEVNVPSGYIVSVDQKSDVYTFTNTRYVTPFYGVATGDDANLTLWTTLAALSLLGLASAVFITKRKKCAGKHGGK